MQKEDIMFVRRIYKDIAMEMDCGENLFLADSKPIEICRVVRGKRCKMERTGEFSQTPDFGFCISNNTYCFVFKSYALYGNSYALSTASVLAYIILYERCKVVLSRLQYIWRQWLFCKIYSLICSRLHI